MRVLDTYSKQRTIHMFGILDCVSNRKFNLIFKIIRILWYMLYDLSYLLKKEYRIYQINVELKER